MNQDMLMMFLKNALANGMKEGGNKFFEEICDGLEPKQLEYLQGVISKVLNRKKHTINVR